VLRQIGDKRAVPALIEALHDKAIDYQAAIALGHLGDKRAIPALRAFLADANSTALANKPRNKDWQRLWAGYGLMWLGETAGLETVLQFLKTGQPWVMRRHAAETLGDFKDKRAVPALLASLRDEEVNVRVSAIRTLGKIGDKSAVPALKGLLKDATPTTSWAPTTVQAAAAQALKQIASTAPAR